MDRNAPIAIYELHLGSWWRLPEEGNPWATYRELAPRLAEYVRRMGFAHVELLPVAEYPYWARGKEPVALVANPHCKSEMLLTLDKKEKNRT